MHGSTTTLDLCASSPHRPLDWRAQLAVLQAAGQLPDYAAHQADDLTRSAAEVLSDAGKSSNSVGLAIALNRGDRWHRAELEGRVLARQSDPDIAREMKLAPKTVSNYVALYFDIRTRLTREFWRSVGAYGPARPRTLTTDDAAVLIRLAGLRLGVTGLLAVRDVLRIDVGKLDLHAVNAVLKHRARQQCAWTWIQVQTLTDPSEVIAHWLALRPESAPAPGRKPDGQRLSDAVAAFIDLIRADAAPEVLQDPPAGRARSAKRLSVLAVR